MNELSQDDYERMEVEQQDRGLDAPLVRAGPTILGHPAPTFIGLCPIHGGEFYFPFEDSIVPVRCPEPDCGRTLIIYERVSA